MSGSKDQLTWAIAQWERALTNEHNEHMRISIRGCIDSLKLERETGEPHCGCHLVPVKNCPYRIKREMR